MQKKNIIKNLNFKEDNLLNNIQIKNKLIIKIYYIYFMIHQ